VTGLVDVHAHLLFDELLGQAGPVGPRLEHDPAGNATLVTGGYSFGLGRTPTTDRDPGRRLAALDAAGIAVQVVSGSPLWFFPHLDADVVRPFARRYNDLMAEWTHTSPDRFKALAVLPVQDISAAVGELRRAVGELGFLGACIGTDARPDLDDPELDELYGTCEELDVPLFLHSVVAGVDGPPGDTRLRRWMRDVTLGYPFEETVAVTSLVLGGVLDRHPRLDVCLSHGGGTMPFVHGRVRDWVATGAAPIDTEQFDRDYARLWFDTHLHSVRSAELLVEIANPERLVFGTNFGGWDSATPGEADELPTDLPGNARRLLRLGADDDGS
jgi:aminocarboxymuconate-semialdehyde decarboxylase